MQITCNPPFWEELLHIKQTLRFTSAVITVVSCQDQSLNKKHTSKHFQARMTRIICIVVLLCFAVYVAENTEIDQNFKDVQVPQDPLLWLNKLHRTQVRYFCFVQFPSLCMFPVLCIKENITLSLEQL